MSHGRDLAALPKAHLHLHLDGAMRRSTLLDLAAAAEIVAVLPHGYGSFAAFTETITAAASCLRTPEDARRLVHEVVEDAAQAGAVWVEPSMWPGLFAGRLGSDADALDVVLRAGQGCTATVRRGVWTGRGRKPQPTAAGSDRPRQVGGLLERCRWALGGSPTPVN